MVFRAVRVICRDSPLWLQSTQRHWFLPNVFQVIGSMPYLGYFVFLCLVTRAQRFYSHLLYRTLYALKLELKFVVPHIIHFEFPCLNAGIEIREFRFLYINILVGISLQVPSSPFHFGNAHTISCFCSVFTLFFSIICNFLYFFSLCYFPFYSGFLLLDCAIFEAEWGWIVIHWNLQNIDF